MKDCIHHVPLDWACNACSDFDHPNRQVAEPDKIEILEARIKKLSALIHYPECWDTFCYPTLESALTEVGCSECRMKQEGK